MSNSECTIQAASPALSSDVVKFFEEFYAITDTPVEQETYVDRFTANATFIRGGAEPTRGHIGRPSDVGKRHDADAIIGQRLRSGGRMPLTT